MHYKNKKQSSSSPAWVVRIFSNYVKAKSLKKQYKCVKLSKAYLLFFLKIM